MARKSSVNQSPRHQSDEPDFMEFKRNLNLILQDSGGESDKDEAIESLGQDYTHQFFQRLVSENLIMISEGIYIEYEYKGLIRDGEEFA